MYNFCTLFDSNFIYYGLAMYESLSRHCKDFHLYIIAFDDKCYEILKQMNLNNTTVIPLNEFENKKLLNVKSKRNKAEYCWTCASNSIKHCIEKYNLDNCTYVDSDIYFYANPSVLINEMGQKSVLITEHRFSESNKIHIINGKYCVQFITFKNTPEGMKVLNDWCNDCIEWCYDRIEDGKFGDQKYLDTWPEKYDCIHELQNLGGGIAPWNIQSYLKSGHLLKEKSTGISFKPVFYHFHNVKFNNGNLNLKAFNDFEIQWFVYILFYFGYFKQLRNLSEKLNSLDSNFIVVASCLTQKIYKYKLYFVLEDYLMRTGLRKLIHPKRLAWLKSEELTKVKGV